MASLVVGACVPADLSAVGDNFRPGISASADHSALVADCTTCWVGKPAQLRLLAHDARGQAYPATDFVVSFAQPTAPDYRLGTWSLDSAGVYRAEATPLVVGKLSALRVLIDGRAVPELELSAAAEGQAVDARASGLAFVTLPQAAGEQVPLSPAVAVQAVDERGAAIHAGPDARLMVTLSSATDLGLVGVATVQARDGLAAFPGIAPGAPGSLQLRATATGAAGDLLAATSGRIEVASGTAAQVVVEASVANPNAATRSDVQAIGLSASGAALRAVEHQDASAEAFAQGHGLGVVYDPGLGALRLGDAGGCNGLATNCTGLDPSWTPRWDQLTAYWPLDGTGAVADGAQVPGRVGPPLTAKNANNDGMQYVPARLAEGIRLDGVDDYLVAPLEVLAAPELTVMAWLRRDNDWDFLRFFDFAERRGYDRGHGLALYLYRGYWRIEALAGASTLFGDTAGPFADGWSHLALTLDGQRATLFLNGNPVGSLPNSGPDLPFFWGNSLLFGASNFPADPTTGADLDELAVWRVALTPEEVATIYRRQRAPKAGVWTSRGMDLMAPEQTISQVAWLTPQPFLKPLPAHGGSESPSYPAIPAGLQGDLAGYWPLDDAGLNLAGNCYVLDLSGQNNHGSLIGRGLGQLTQGVVGALGGGLWLHDEAFVQTRALRPAPNTFSAQLWFQAGAQSPRGLLLGFSAVDGVGSGSSDRLAYLDSRGGVSYGVASPVNRVIESPQTHLLDLAWHHLVISLGATGMRLFVDGVKVAQDPTVTAGFSYDGRLKFGYALNDMYLWTNNVGNYSTAFISEAAQWSRELSGQEVLALYRRGANRLSHQLRGCRDPACVDASPWQGPDGTPLTTYSELDNRDGREIRAQVPNLVVTGIAGRAVQYRTFFASDDQQALCTYPTLGATPQPCSPELSALSLSPAHYPTSSPSLTSAVPKAYVALAHLEATLGAEGCPAGLRLMLSGDGSRWWAWHDGSWQVAPAGAGHATALADLDDQALAGFAAAAGPGELSVRVFLSSDGTTPCALERLVMHVRQ